MELTATQGVKMLYLIKRRPTTSREELVMHWYKNHMPAVIKLQQDAEAAVAKAKQALEGADDMPGLTEELNAINGEIAVLEALDDQALAIVALSQSNGDFAQLSGKVAELNEARSIKLAEWQAKQAPVQKQVGSRRTSDLRSLGWMSIWGKPALFAAVIMIFFVLLFRENGNAKNQDNES